MVFLGQVVVSRRDDGIRRWNRWLREGLSSRPYAWLRPDFVPPSPFLVVKDPHAESSRILVEPHLIDAEFRKAWMPYFCRTGHPPVSAEQFLDFVGHLLPQENFLGSSSDYGSGFAGGGSCQESYCRWSGWLGLE